MLNCQNELGEQESVCLAVTNFEVPRNVYWLCEMSSKYCRQHQPSGQVFLCIDCRETKWSLMYIILPLVLLIKSILIMILMIRTAQMRSCGRESWTTVTNNSVSGLMI